MANTIGCLVMDLVGTELTAEERDLIQHPLVGGVILFTRNYQSRFQLKSLCTAIRQAKQSPILIMADQEGGRVQRFRDEFTRMPSMGYFGEQYKTNPQKALQWMSESAWLLATELVSAGIDLSLGPVLDLDRGLNTVIGNRAFAAESETVVALAKAFQHGLSQAGMAATGKHFPGHGAVHVDSHIGLPVDERSFEEVKRTDLQPFIAMIEAGIPAILAAHIVFPAIDALPAGFSRRWLHDILRGELKFTGTILSDDLHMEAANISADYADRVLAAREAGCDFALVCNHRPGVIAALDKVPAAMHQVAPERWQPLYIERKELSETFQTTPRWREIHSIITTLNEGV